MEQQSDNLVARSAGKMMAMGIILRSLMLRMAEDSGDVTGWLDRERENALRLMALLEHDLPATSATEEYFDAASTELARLLAKDD